jgi:uncharacterized membrane protein YdjX (TVP38/TMEM64 family)
MPHHRVLRAARHHTRLLKLAAVAVLLLAAFLLLRSLPVERPLTALKDRVDDLGPWGPVLFMLFFIVSTVVILPGWPITVAAGAVFGPILGTGVISAASTASAAVSFLLARYSVHGRVSRAIARFPKLQAIYRALGTGEGWKLVAAVRLGHVGPYGLQNFVFGLTPVRFATYLVTTWLVQIPGTFAYVYLGHVGGATLEGETSAGLPHSVQLLGAAGVLAGVTFGALVARRALKQAPAPQ